MVNKRSVTKNVKADLRVRDDDGVVSLNTNRKIVPLLPPLLFSFVKEITDASSFVLQYNSSMSQDAQDEYWSFDIQFGGGSIATLNIGSNVDGLGFIKPVRTTFNNGSIQVILEGLLSTPKLTITPLAPAGEGAITIVDTHYVSNGVIRCSDVRTSEGVLSLTPGGSFSTSFSSSFSTP